jgi:cytochrome o ubiquinol oxidase subunit 2
MTKRHKKISPTTPILLTILGLASLGLLITVLLQGTDVALLSPKGFIATEQRRLMLFSVFVLLEIAIPTLTVFYFVAWKYRESNEKATYAPHARHGKSLVFGIWAVPCTFMLILASVMWPATHKLAPQKLIDNGAKPLTIQVIAMRWKWLFIYPEQKIATVNFVQIPTDTPVQFELTADETPMSSFWIPHLGGQLYAMTGHLNQLNLMADAPGDFAGSSAEINGAGFAGMKFTARASSMADFNAWVQEVGQSPAVLNSAEYEKLLVPSESNQAALYSKADPDIYANMLMKYAGSHSKHTGHE